MKETKCKECPFEGKDNVYCRTCENQPKLELIRTPMKLIRTPMMYHIWLCPELIKSKPICIDATPNLKTAIRIVDNAKYVHFPDIVRIYTRVYGQEIYRDKAFQVPQNLFIYDIWGHDEETNSYYFIGDSKDLETAIDKADKAAIEHHPDTIKVKVWGNECIYEVAAIMY